jgi:filamentous hemagglutinin family protein
MAIDEVTVLLKGKPFSGSIPSPPKRTNISGKAKNAMNRTTATHATVTQLSGKTEGLGQLFLILPNCLMTWQTIKLL